MIILGSLHRVSLLKVFFTLALGLLTLAGCQSDLQLQFKKVRKGQEKDQVIELLGSPDRTQRIRGVDRWSYLYANDQGRIVESQVHFVDGRTTYVGPPPPESDAAEREDSQNEKTNSTLEEEFERQRQELSSQPRSSRPAEPATKGQPAEPTITPLPEFEEIK